MRMLDGRTRERAAPSIQHRASESPYYLMAMIARTTPMLSTRPTPGNQCRISPWVGNKEGQGSNWAYLACMSSTTVNCSLRHSRTCNNNTVCLAVTCNRGKHGLLHFLRKNIMRLAMRCNRTLRVLRHSFSTTNVYYWCKTVPCKSVGLRVPSAGGGHQWPTSLGRGMQSGSGLSCSGSGQRILRLMGASASIA